MNILIILWRLLRRECDPAYNNRVRWETPKQIDGYILAKVMKGGARQ
jgi:hypothetical protein